MTEFKYSLTDEEWAEALKASMDASFKARFVDNDPDHAEAIGIAAGQAKVREIALRHVPRGFPGA